MSEKHKIYGFNNGGSPGWFQAIALGDDGVVVGEHICSHECFMSHDLGMDGRSNWKHENYNKHFGEGNWVTEFIPSEKLKAHEGLQAAIATAMAKQAKDRVDCERAGVTITTVDEAGKETDHFRGGAG